METCEPKKTMEIYFKNVETKYFGFKERNRIILTTVSSEDLKRVETSVIRENLKTPPKLSTMDDLTKVRKKAEDRIN